MRDLIYLDNASTSYPKPPELLQSIEEYIKNYPFNAGRTDFLSSKVFEIIDDTRQKLANLIGAQKKYNIVFTHNATHGLNTAIKGIGHNSNHILICSYSHNSVIRPVNRLKMENIISDFDFFSIDSNGEINFDDLAKLVRDNTSLLVVSHASNVIGVKTDVSILSQFCKRCGIKLLVDATQSLIYSDINVIKDDIDILVCTGHKSLLGPTGVGFMYIKDPEIIDSLMEGGSIGNSSSSPYQPQIMPYKFESGTLNTLSIAGLNGSLSYIFDKTPDQIKEHSLSLTEKLYNALAEKKHVILYGTSDFSKKVPILSFNLNGILPSEASNFYASQANIFIRAGLHCAPKIHEDLGTLPSGNIRVSPGIYNTEYEIDKFIKATQKLLDLKLEC